MREKMQRLREKLGVPSGRAIAHIVVVEGILNLVWNQVSKMFTIPLIREMGFLVLTVAGLFAVAWYLPKLAPKWSGATQSDRSVQKAQLPEPWLRRLLEDDKASLGGRIYLTKHNWHWEGLRRTDSYMELTLTVINAASFPVLVTGAEGRFLICGQECARPAEMQDRRGIPHGERGDILVRQWLSSDMMNLIVKQPDDIEISLRACRLIIEAEVPGEEPKPTRIHMGTEFTPSLPRNVWQ